MPLHDDLFDFIYVAMPGYEEVGRRRVLLGCWGAFQDPDVCNFNYRDMTQWGRAMGVTPGIVVDGKLVTNDLVDINLGIRILLGSSYYDSWEGQEMFVTRDPLGNPVDRNHPWNQTTIPQPQKRDFDDKYSWVMSPRWFDGKDHLALDTGGGPIARLWSTALSGLVDTDFLKATGHQRGDPPAPDRPEARGEFRVEDPPVVQRHRTGPVADLFPGVFGGRRPRVHREGAGRGAGRPHQDVGAVRGARRGHRLWVHRGGAGRAVTPHGDQGRQDRELPPVSAHTVERQPTGTSTARPDPTRGR